MKTRSLGLACLGRTFVAVFLCVSLISQAAYASVLHPSAQSFNLQTWNQTAKALQPRLNVSVRPAAKAVAEKMTDPKSAARHGVYAGQILILLLALNGVELVRSQAREAKLKGRKLSNEEYSKLAAEAALKVVDSGDLWFGIAGDVSTAALMEKPKVVLKEILKNKVARPLFVNLLHSGILSLMSFVGFQAASQLWREARLMLDPKDYEKSERIWSLGFSAMIDLADPKNTSDDSRIARQMFSNIVKILLVDDELRENWFYNTWRLSIATGRFVTLLSGIITATAVGTALFPGAGSMLGFGFALTGAVAAAALPASFTEKITFKLKDTRIAVSKAEARQQNWRLKNLVESYNNRSLWWHWQATDESINLSVKKLQELRERVTTAYIEEIYIANTNIQKRTYELAIATANRRAKEYVQTKNLLDKELSDRRRLFGKMIGYYSSQYRHLDAIKVSFATPKEIVALLESEKVKVATVQSFLTTFAQALSNSSQYPSSEAALQNFHLRSFREIGITRLDILNSVKLP